MDAEEKPSVCSFCYLAFTHRKELYEHIDFTHLKSEVNIEEEIDVKNENENQEPNIESTNLDIQTREGNENLMVITESEYLIANLVAPTVDQCSFKRGYISNEPLSSYSTRAT